MHNIIGVGKNYHKFKAPKEPQGELHKVAKTREGHVRLTSQSKTITDRERKRRGHNECPLQ